MNRRHFFLAALAGLAACGKQVRKEAPPVPVLAAAAERRSVPFTIEANGTVEPLETVAIESQVTGVLLRVPFKEGDEVRQGQVLFEIDPAPYRAALDQARGMLARDEAQLVAAKADVQRFDVLVQKEYVTTQQADQTRATAGALEATVQADRAAVESAHINLQNATIRSPITGKAGSLQLRAGNLVRANSGTPLVTVNRIHPILVRFAVPATELDQIRRYRDKPLAVRAKPTGGSTVSTGTLAFLDNAVDSATGTLLLKASFDNSDGALWPGQYVHVALELYVQPDALVVPSTAVVAGQQGSYVFVVKPDRTTEVRDVRVARPAGDVTVLEGGIEPGEQVVTEGQLRLTAGAKVMIKPPATPAASAGTRGT
ncbi:MAG TPA: efflux RND transporter periplasmic adaptor subunit [Gemmatimonadales bacterium]|nr:efflux RND transporter periplasmic adaptor subunit [Gemmatimonadales bacterium]